MILDTLERWHEQMSTETRLVFDHDDAWERIMECARRVSHTPVSEQAESYAEQAKQLQELSDELMNLDDHIDGWDGPGRHAFDGTISSLKSRVAVLAEVGEHSSSLLATADAGRMAGDELIRDLVHTSIDFAERTLVVARTMNPLTNGVSMSQWTITNLSQVNKLLHQLDEALQQVDVLVEQVSYLIEELTDAAAALTNDLTSLNQHLAS